jgi:4-hydroxybenzoate polyprenyltransferase/phosphoserine phosphatase
MTETLVVDLDGTLLRSNMLFECFWSALGRDWRTPFLSASALLRGRAALKNYLATSADIDVTTLPYDPEVIAYIEKWRASGGRTALVTATDQSLATRISEHLGVFDEVYGSDGIVNLKGPNKATFLESKFGTRGFAYVGDCGADLKVWKVASRAITANASASVRRQARTVVEHCEDIQSHSGSLKHYIRALRPHQWAKNSLVFLPVLAAHQFEEMRLLFSVLAFVTFSLIASSVYILNDLLDLKADRAHPRKRSRPFASGNIPIESGTWLFAGLFLAGAAGAIAIGQSFFLVMLGYFVLTLAYSFNLKRRMIADICVLAGLYTLRIVAGAAATETKLSIWLLAFSISFFFALAAVKRQSELVDSISRGKLKPAGRGYHVEDLPIISMIAVSAGYTSVVVLALYVTSPAVVGLYTFPEALWGVCAVLLYWITRAIMFSHRGYMDDDPVVYAMKDKVSLICFVLILVLALAGTLA